VRLTALSGATPRAIGRYPDQGRRVGHLHHQRRL
jgi:hypothetical protein